VLRGSSRLGHRRDRWAIGDPNIVIPAVAKQGSGIQYASETNGLLVSQECGRAGLGPLVRADRGFFPPANSARSRSIADRVY